MPFQKGESGNPARGRRSHAVGSRGRRQGDRRLRGGARDESLRGTPGEARKRGQPM